MNAQHTTDEQTPATRYDLIVRLPESPDMVQLQQQASTRLQLGQEKAARLMQHLEQRGATRIKADIPQDEAERTAQNFRDAGFQVEMKPALALLDKNATLADSECPGCQRMMRPTPQRQCPYCHIYLDKIDPEKLRLKQIREEELRKLNARLQREGELGSRQNQEDSERALRNRIRAELEKELGLHQPWLAFFRGSRGVLRAGSIVVLLGAAFFGGYRLASPSGQALAPEQRAALAQGMLNQIMGGGLAGLPADLEAFAQSPDGAALAQGSSDSLLTTPVAGVAGASGEWQGVAASVQKVSAQHAAVLGEKQNLALALVVALAESGQAQRANELLARLQATPGYQAGSARSAELLASAWTLLQRPGGISTQALDELATEASQLKPQDAALFYARVASMLAASPQLSAAVWQAWLDKARAQLSQLSGAVMRDYTTSQLQRWHAQALLNALQANAAKGRWAEVKPLLSQLQASHAATPGPVFGLLRSQGELAAGNAPAAAQQLQQAYAQAVQAAAKGDTALGALADHQGALAVAPLLTQLDATVAAQQASMQAPLYSAMASMAAAAGMADASTLYQQRVAAALTGSEGRDEQMLALSVACSTRLAQYYLRARQPALAEQQLRKAAAVVVPLLPAAPAAGQGA
jgi:hypothetical protein